MKDFIYHNPCKVYFGKNQIQYLGDELLKYGHRVLLVYGGGSIKKQGLYAQIMQILKDYHIDYEELYGVEPNPRYTTVNRGIRICLDKCIDVVLAIGGGSVIDCAKGIAAGVYSTDYNVWSLIEKECLIDQALPIIAIPTSAATGSEMNGWAVISNQDTFEKKELGGRALIPQVAFENPEYTYSLSRYQTACGAFDIFSHVLDNYYLSEDTFDLILHIQEDVMRTVVKWAPIALNDPHNYEARANLMWASSLALNSLLDGGMMHEGVCHVLEHELSAYYDITHGEGLAIITPRWLSFILDDFTASRIYRLGIKVFDIDHTLAPLQGAKDTIKAIESFCFEQLGLRNSLSSLGINERDFEVMALHASEEVDMDVQDIISIYKMCL